MAVRLYREEQALVMENPGCAGAVMRRSLSLPKRPNWHRKQRFAAPLGVLAALLATFALPAAACGPESNCGIGERHYRIRMPAGHDGKTPVPVLLFAHGYTATPAAVMANAGLARTIDGLGAALIAPKSAYKGWALANAPRAATRPAVDEPAFIDAVLADAASRFSLDLGRVVASGFSSGGMMAWTLACQGGDRYAGFIPIAGTFWAPVPSDCPARPASLVHLHGDADQTVPLDGRAIADTRQGRVADALSLFARHGGFGLPEPVRNGHLRCQKRTNAAGQVLAFCLYPGGHGFAPEDIPYAWGLIMGSGRN